jgi:hypothetical protein
MATNRIAGIASVTVDGLSYLLQGELEWSPSTVTRETMAGEDQIHGYKEMPVSGYISMVLRDTGGLAVEDFNQMTDVTVNIQLANGKSVVGNNMWTVKEQEVKSTEATFPVRFEGPTGCVTEVLATS